MIYIYVSLQRVCSDMICNGMYVRVCMFSYVCRLAHTRYWIQRLCLPYSPSIKRLLTFLQRPASRQDYLPSKPVFFAWNYKMDDIKWSICKWKLRKHLPNISFLEDPSPGHVSPSGHGGQAFDRTPESGAGGWWICLHHVAVWTWSYTDISSYIILFKLYHVCYIILCHFLSC